MRCPYCDAQDNYLCKQSRPTEHFRVRRLECLSCGNRFTTFEGPVELLNLSEQARREWSDQVKTKVKHYKKAGQI